MENFSLQNITTYQAGVAQASMHRLVQKLSDKILRPFGITKMQWMIIGIVLDAGKEGIRVSDVADALSTTIAYLTNSINLLESMDILQRRDNTQDSRSKLVTVKPAYVPKCKEIEDAMRRALRATIYSQVDREEFITYFKVVFQLIDVAKDQDTDALIEAALKQHVKK